MGIRSALKKDLMNLDRSGLMTADDVRRYLQTDVVQDNNPNTLGFNLIARFNAHHNQVQCGLPSHEPTLTHERHRLFKEVLYPKAAVKKWASLHGA